ncbi:MAG: efflux RND transporter permease subunit [Syntrophomonadaceae bacterium]|nr:efflux RND transporter permease subunit [Syntrophomonadaceae bacterium]
MLKKLAQTAVKRPVTMAIVLTVVIIFGIFSLIRTKVDLMPEMEYPMILAMTTYAGAGPEEVETQVTEPMEGAVASLSGIKNMYSYSSSNQSILLLEFEFGTNLDNASLDVRENISLYESFMPEGVGTTSYMRMNLNMMPVIQVGITSEESGLTLAQLQELAEETIVPRLQRIEQVASVTATGGLEREITVAVDQVRLENYGLTLAQVSQYLSADNFSLSGGEIVDGGRTYYVRNLQDFESVDDIKEVGMITSTGNVVYLGDVATIVDGYKEQEQYTRINGSPAIGIAVMKNSDANTSETCIAVKHAMDEIQAELGIDLQVHSIMDQSEFIEESLNTTVEHLLVGTLLVVLIMFVFLRNVRSTLIVAISIPISVIATFILLYFGGSTINIITLGGLTLGIGRIIDDSIVVFENIYRHRSEGEGMIDAAINGTGEVGGAVLASTLTLVAVFAPIMLSGGLAGMIFAPFASTIVFAILCSLLVSLTIVPLLSSRVLTDKAMMKLQGRNAVSRKFFAFGNWLDGLGEKYHRLLSWALSHRRKVIAGVGVALIVTCCFIPIVGAEFIPVVDEGQISITMETDKGNPLDTTNEVANEVEALLAQVPEAELIYVSVGAGSVMMTSAASNSATIYMMLCDAAERDRSTEMVAEDLRTALSDIPGAKFTVEVSSSMSMGSSSAISVAISGDELDVLRDLSDQALALIGQVEGARELSSSMVDGNMEVQITVDRRLAAQYGLTPYQVANAVSNANSGVVAARYSVGGDEIDVRVRYADQANETLEDLKNLTVRSNMGLPVILSQVADFQIAQGPTTIDRVNQVRQVTISGSILGRDLNSVTNDIQAQMEKLDLPPGYTVEYGGQTEQMMDSFVDLAYAMLAALILVYAVMAIQYESFLNPFIIMFSIPLSVIGAVFGLLLTGRAFGITAFIGMIMLLGVVVANAIVYIDYLEQLRRRGMPRNEAILEAGRLRLRPILMTAFATMLAMVPLAIGKGDSAELMAPLATVVICGLLVSTMLTLVFIPVLYSIFDDWNQRGKERRRAKREAKAQAEAVAEA